MSQRCVLFGAGNYKDADYRHIQGDYVIAVDGGYSYLIKQGIVPDALIGDMDSFSAKKITGEESFPFIKLPTHKDDTDMLAGIRFGLEKGFHEFALYGALGGRLDHTIANIQCLKYLLDCKAKGTIYDDNQELFLLSDEKRIYDQHKTGRMSLFAFSEQIQSVTLKGFEYELQNTVIHNSYPVGISNSFTEKTSSIEVHGGIALIMLKNNE